MKKLLQTIRAKSQYGKMRWEPSMLFGSQNPNAPFRPVFINHRDALKSSAELDSITETWSGDMGTWSMALKAKAEHRIEFWIYSLGDCGELETNFYVHLLSETKAVCQDCGGKPYIVQI